MGKIFVINLLKKINRKSNPFSDTYHKKYFWTFCTNEDRLVLYCCSFSRTTRNFFIVLFHFTLELCLMWAIEKTWWLCILWNHWKFCFSAVECSRQCWKLRKDQPFSVARLLAWMCSQSRQFLVFKPFFAGEEND